MILHVSSWSTCHVEDRVHLKIEDIFLKSHQLITILFSIGVQIFTGHKLVEHLQTQIKLLRFLGT